jgi:hypothetical protein
MKGKFLLAMCAASNKPVGAASTDANLFGKRARKNAAFTTLRLPHKRVPFLPPAKVNPESTSSLLS